MPRLEQQKSPQVSQPWEGPYIIIEVLKLGTYKLKTTNGQVFANA
jgi:hypothetical protein